MKPELIWLLAIYSIPMLDFLFKWGIVPNPTFGVATVYLLVPVLVWRCTRGPAKRGDGLPKWKF